MMINDQKILKLIKMIVIKKMKKLKNVVVNIFFIF